MQRRARAFPPHLIWEIQTMLGWAITFFIVAIVAAALGFGGIAGSAVAIAQVLFFVFLVLFLVSLVWHLVSGRRPPAI
jgi:uncharacterized membrane protein YtjA (UPF0391 family)